MKPVRHSLDSIARLAEASGSDIPDQFRVFALAWAKADAHAYRLRIGLDAELARRCKALGYETSIAAAERTVKATQEWKDLLDEHERAVWKANEAKAEMEFWRMKWQAQLIVAGHAQEAAA